MDEDATVALIKFQKEWAPDTHVGKQLKRILPQLDPPGHRASRNQLPFRAMDSLAIDDDSLVLNPMSVVSQILQPTMHPLRQKNAGQDLA